MVQYEFKVNDVVVDLETFFDKISHHPLCDCYESEHDIFEELLETGSVELDYDVFSIGVAL